MKKSILLFISVLILSSFQTASSEDFNIVGRWKTEKDNETIFIIFEADGYTYFENNGKQIGGKEYEENGQKMSLTYDFDTTTTPYHIDLIATIHSEEDKVNRVECIIEKINNNEIKLAMGRGEKRPTEFDEENSAVFTRVIEE